MPDGVCLAGLIWQGLPGGATARIEHFLQGKIRKTAFHIAKRADILKAWNSRAISARKVPAVCAGASQTALTAGKRIREFLTVPPRRRSGREIRMKFTKMHGCGNDYVYVNGFEEKIPQEKKPELVRFLSDRHRGIGGDGVIFINPSQMADFEMEMYNADGSRAEMCGNGIRCVAKYVYDKGLTDQKSLSIVSAGRIKYLELTTDGTGRVSLVRVNMGNPILEPEQIPVRLPGERAVNVPIQAAGREWRMTCVSMGNPHAVVFVEDVEGLDLAAIGPEFENHPLFPNRTNTEFVQVLDRGHVKMRVWERGTGETLACGTGCCATAAACVLNDLTDDKVSVTLLGGELLIEWDRKENLIYMTGPAAAVFEGEIPLL